MTTKTQGDASIPNGGAEPAKTVARRSFLGTASKIAASGAAASAIGLGATNEAEAALWGDGDRNDRRDRELLRDNLQLRVERAYQDYAAGIPPHVNNGDEERYANKIGTDTRGLPHNQRGEVDLAAWATLTHALDTQREADFEKVTLGGTRKLVQPLGTLAVNLTGLATPQHSVPPAPTLASAERAAEAVEAYWQALLRDVPFSEYRSDTQNDLVLSAAAELSSLSGYTGPRNVNGVVTPELLFRGTARYRDASDRKGRRSVSVVPPGVTVGPYISQFVLRDIPYAVQGISALLRVPNAGAANEFLGTHAEWLANQDGRPVTRTTAFSSTRRYLSNGRDLAEYAHGGAPAFWGASQILGNSRAAGGIGAPLHPNNPYFRLTKSASGVGTFALGYVQGFLPLSSSREIRANYWQKWYVHRTIRPEAFGGLVHQFLANDVDYPLHDDILTSEAVARAFEKNGTYLLTSAYPEGAPNHGSYPGGASSIGAVNATILKAFFDEDFVIPDPVQLDPTDPTRLIPYVGPPLTLGGELNKLATNLGQGRNWAGIHWRSDAASSLPQAEEVAIALLRDERDTYKESFAGFSFTRFDGTRVSF